ncbi:MAG: hypothetical protein KAY37_02155 [Phycisphaerae bacterium]|nr:hypothetical protein [Phycisphaerae bacterium]
MATFLGRRYMRPVEAISRTEKVVGVLILLLVVGIVAGFVLQVTTNRDYLFNVAEQDYARATAGQGGSDTERARGPSAEVDNPFPALGLAGWRAPQQVGRFTADNLYAKIDGRAEAYMKFHVVGLTFGRYHFERDAERTVDVYWYDLGAPANALGIYKSEEAPGARSVVLGRAGYQVGGAVFFCKGSSYVQVLPSLADADAQAALMIAEHLAERIEEE